MCDDVSCCMPHYSNACNNNRKNDAAFVALRLVSSFLVRHKGSKNRRKQTRRTCHHLGRHLKGQRKIQFGQLAESSSLLVTRGLPLMQLDALASGTISARCKNATLRQVRHATWLNISLASFEARLIQLPVNKFTCAA